MKNCVICNSENLKIEIGEEVFTSSSKMKLVVADCKFHVCQECGTHFIDREYYQTVYSKIKEFEVEVIHEKQPELSRILKTLGTVLSRFELDGELDGDVEYDENLIGDLKSAKESVENIMLRNAGNLIRPTKGVL